MSDTLEVADWPTKTAPKVTDPGEACSAPELVVAFTPWFTLAVQPVRQKIRHNAARNRGKRLCRFSWFRSNSGHDALEQRTGCSNSSNESLAPLNLESNDLREKMNRESINVQNSGAAAHF